MVQSLSQILMLFPISHIGKTLTFCGNIFSNGFLWVRAGSGCKFDRCHRSRAVTDWMWWVMHGPSCENVSCQPV